MRTKVNINTNEGAQEIRTRKHHRFLNASDNYIALPQTIMTRATANVLATPKLLESILFELPPRDLLLAQRVNSTFRDQITGSKRIQRKLFFTTDDSETQEEGITLNPFLGHILPVVIPDSEVFIVRTMPILDPIASDNEEELGDYSYGQDLRVVEEEKNVCLDTSCEDDTVIEEASAVASWRRMFVARGPVPFEVNYWYDGGQVTLDNDEEEELIFPERISDLVDQVAVMIRALYYSETSKWVARD